ncbi:MAG: GHKL domain-containing protein [Ignavibacteriales bacterium]|nr:MAG: GHKL domain-containing protein [Ignavibacteriales bacterium]
MESGSQNVTNYSPKEYNAISQNRAIAQSETGIMYFGNWSGLLEFDGTKWRLYQLDNKSAVNSIAIKDGKYYVGGIGELGYFTPDSLGRLTFHSLLKYLPEDKKEFSNVWNIYISNDHIYFLANNYIFIWNNQKGKFKILQSDAGFHIMFSVNGSLYVRERGKGLLRLTEDSLTLLNGSEIFANESVFVMLPFFGETDAILIVTRTMGLYKYDGNNFTPFKTEADDFIKENLTYSARAILSDGNILLGTLHGGAIIIDSSGKEIRRYNLESGIINNTVYYAFQDRAGAIWLATDNGISRIDYASPITYFDSRNNFETIPIGIIRHNEILYVASTSGVYYLHPKTSDLHKIKEINKQSWGFLEQGKDLLVGTDDGLFKVEDNKALPVRDRRSNGYQITVIKQSKINSDRIFLGTVDGLYTKLKSGNQWIDEAQILKLDDQKNSIMEEADGSLWIGTVASGIFRIVFLKDREGNTLLDTPLVEHFNESNGLQSGQISVDKINGVNYFFSLDSIFKFDASKKIFFSDTSDKIISDFYNLSNNQSVLFFGQDSLERLWLITKGRVAMGTFQKDSSYKWVTAPFNSFADEEIYGLYAEKDGKVWFCTSTGIIKYDFGKKQLGSIDYASLVRKVEIGEDSTIYFGGKVVNPVMPEITFENNSVKFWYSAASYEGRNINNFKTFLEGFDDDWSQYSTETKKEYTNLPPGKYTFKVAALNILDNESSTGTYSFEILPPWYRTWLAYSFYILIFGFGVYITDRTQRNRLIRKERLRAEYERKEEQLKHAKEIEKAYKELKDTQAQLIHSEKMASLGELTAGIAHEIKNPLNFVNNFSEISRELLDEIRTGLRNKNEEEVIELIENLKQNLEKINQHGKRADSIVKGMLLHSRGSSGEKTLTDINDLLDQYVNLAYHGMRAANKDFNITIEKNYDESIEKINVIPQDISRVFLNIINNACYAAYDKQKKAGNDFSPILKVSTKNLHRKVEVRIKDNGMGIPDKIKDKLFNPFFTTKPTGEGTGLGLSLSYDIVVKQHSGDIRFETEENKYTEFIITLPNNL